MFGWTSKTKIRRKQVREQRAKHTGDARIAWFTRLVSWPVIATFGLVAMSSMMVLISDTTIEYVIGQRIDQPIYSKVDFQIPDPERTASALQAARSQTPSYYKFNPSAITFDRVRTDLIRLYQTAADSEKFQDYKNALKESNLPLERKAYERLRKLAQLPEDGGRALLNKWVEGLPLNEQFVVKGLMQEPRTPSSTADYVLLEMPDDTDVMTLARVSHFELVRQRNEKAMRLSAAEVARELPASELHSTLGPIVLAAFQEQPTIIYDQERTVEAMREAEASTPEVMTTYERAKPFINPGVLGSKEYLLLQAHRDAYTEFLYQEVPEAIKLRRERFLQHTGMVILLTILIAGFMLYTRTHHPAIFELRRRTLAFVTLILGTVAASILLTMKWPHIPELVVAPCLFTASVFAIVYPRNFAIGAMSILAVFITTILHGQLVFLLTLGVGVVMAAYLLDEIRTRTKLITSGMITAIVIIITSASGGLLQGLAPEYNFPRALTAGGCALLAAFVVSGVLPFIEKIFHIATSLTLLEWRDPTRPLLQLLAREAPGTYNHSLVLGTLAEAACERIGANGLLAQVGALYHDIGKIHKADYFAENQAGPKSRHENLAPTMSLLIILGHVKDGIEMASEYKLPPVLHKFIGEHHGTTLIRYFHHVATEMQPQISSGKHDRKVPEAEFRYAGPKPRARESAVLMLCDGVEGAVRALHEPTVGRIESVVHEIVTDRLNDGQFDDCDITLQQIRQVEESLVKSLCSIYHGRVAYPKAQKSSESRKVSV